MAAVKNTTTQAQALAYVIEHFGADIPEDILAKLNELYTAKTKKYDRPKVASKERRLNESLVPQVVELIKGAGQELVNATWVNANFDNPEVRSPQKARVIVELAIEQGLVEKYQEKGRTYYRAL